MAHADSNRSVATIERQTARRRARHNKQVQAALADYALRRLMAEHNEKGQ